jgi:outer membrane protein assembly factor BamB
MSVRGMDKAQKSGPHAVPCVAYGKVLAIGGLGNIYCLDARTGKVAWQKISDRARQRVAEAKANKKRGKVNRYENCTSPTFAAGLFIVPRGNDVVGMDPSNGRELWRVEDVIGKTCSPIRWMYGDREFIIAGYTAIEPRSGKVMWKAPNATVSNYTPVCKENRLVVPIEAAGKDDGIAGYEIAPQGARQIWKLGAEYDAQNYCSPVIMKEMVLYKIAAKQRGRSHLIAVNVNTGQEIGRTPDFRSDACASMVAGDNIAIYEDGLMVLADPRNPQIVWNTFSRGDCNPLYADSHTSCLVGGIWFVRGQNRVRCYDLRR